MEKVGAGLLGPPPQGHNTRSVVGFRVAKDFTWQSEDI